MTNITPFVLVLALTGGPVASVVCATECQHEPAPSGHCHGDMTASEGPMMSASYGCNDLSISDGPYVIEHRAVSGAPVLAVTHWFAALELAWTDAPVVFPSAEDAWLKPPLVLRL